MSLKGRPHADVRLLVHPVSHVLLLRKVANYDNKNTRRAASALVEALVERLFDKSKGSERMTTKGRINRIIREGEAIGAL